MTQFTSSSVTELAFAKINLFLEIIARRPDGYHDIGTLFQTVQTCDMLEASTAPDGVLELEYDTPQPYPVQSDLVLKAARLLLRRASSTQGARLFLHKRLPLGGGLGGGSADAAAALRLLNRLWGLGLSVHQLEALGAELGADVAFLVQGGTAWAEGIGDRLAPTPSPVAPDSARILLATPNCEVPTQAAYDGCRPAGVEFWESYRAQWPAAQANGLLHVPLFNRFEETVLPKYPEIADLRRHMIAFGARSALLSGSGATVFGVFAQASEAEHALEALHGKLRFGVVTALQGALPS